MEQYEIDSFISKFQNLCHAGRNANLTFTSKAGKAIVNLSVELGSLHPPAPIQRNQPPRNFPHHPRNGPSHQRRRQKRAEARRVTAEEATHELSNEEAEILELAEEAYRESKVDKEASEIVAEEAKDITGRAEKVSEEPIDELCPDNVYDSEN